jgi:hypothetical protein
MLMLIRESIQSGSGPVNKGYIQRIHVKTLSIEDKFGI